MKIICLKENKNIKFALDRFKGCQFRVERVVICNRVFTICKETQKTNLNNLFNIKL